MKYIVMHPIGKTQREFLDKLNDQVEEEKETLMGDKDPPMQNVTLKDILIAVAHFSSRIGPDPFPKASPHDTYHPFRSSTWCLNTWKEERVWKMPFIGTHVFVTLMDFSNKKSPRGRSPFFHGPPQTGLYLACVALGRIFHIL